MVKVVEKKGHKYSSGEFDDYKMRYIIRFERESFDHFENYHIYTTNLNVDDVLQDFKERVLKVHPDAYNINVVHTATREQDERTTKFLEELDIL